MTLQKSVDKGQALHGPREPEPHFVPLASFTSRSQGCDAVFAYWSQLPREEGCAPSAEGCDLLDITDDLPFCALLDINSETEYLVRFFGTGLVDRYGLDLTGLNAYEVFDSDSRDSVAARMALLCSAPAVFRTISNFTTPKGLPLAAEWLFLPLQDSGGVVRHSLLSIGILSAEVAAGDSAMGGSLGDRQVLDITIATL